MLRRVITVALALMLSWTGFSGHEVLLPPETNESVFELAEERPGTLDEHHLDDIPVRVSPDLQDTQDLAALIPHRIPCAGGFCQPPRPDASAWLPEPWLATPQRPPRRA